MSGPDDALPPLDERTRRLIASLIEASVQSALAARDTPTEGNGDGGARSDILPSEPAGADDPSDAEVRAGAGGTAEVPRRGRGGGRGIDDPQHAEEELEEDEGGEDEDDADAEEEDGAGGSQAFTAAWYEARGGRQIPPRFHMPQRFKPQYPVAFPAESVEHFQIFGSGNASVGREGEAGALYCSAAYLSEISNTLADVGKEIEAIEAVIIRDPAAAVERLREARWDLSNAQLAGFGIYELSASRYELLCGLQGASGVADPALLGSFLDAPAAYSSAGRLVFRRQHQQAIKSAAQVAGRRQVRTPAPVTSGASTASIGGRGVGANSAEGRRSRSTGRRRRGGRGGGTAATSARNN